ncbi:hypothetical protein [Elizabethkingia meningoseptica]|nr:hypothetical protein [Elizabethkingia meningoseptica]WBS73913.1 hypothetical protein PF438_13535 [Elizabethkingia meningoseptica]
MKKLPEQGAYNLIFTGLSCYHAAHIAHTTIGISRTIIVAYSTC